VSDSNTLSKITDCREPISTASETESSSHPEGKFSPTMFREYQQEGSRSIDKARVVLTDLRHDPLYGKTITRRQKDTWLESKSKATLGKTSGSSLDLPRTQYSPCHDTASPAHRKQENSRTLQ